MGRALTRWENTLIFLGVVMYLFVFPHGIHGDASVRYDSLLRSFAEGRLVPMMYSYVHPLVSAPLLLFGHLYKDGFWWICRFNAFLFLGATWFASRATGHGRVLVLLLFGATMFPKHVTDYYAEVFCSVLILCAILWFQRGRSILAIAAVCLSVWNVFATFVGGFALLVYFAFRSRRWRYFAAIPLLPLGFLLENYLKYGDPYPSAYLAALVGPRTLQPYAMGPGFSFPLFFGLLNVLLSFGRGILFFAPGLLFLFYPGFWRATGAAEERIRAGAIYLGGLVLVYAKYYCWHGGAFWGPRYFLFASILAVLLLATFREREDTPAFWRVLWVGAVAVSGWVACQGVLFGNDFQEDCFKQGFDLEVLCYYVPEYSVLWRFFVVGPPITGRRVAFLIYFLLVTGTLLWSPVRRLVAEGWQALRGAVRTYSTGWRA